jgi:hypothetical protein
MLLQLYLQSDSSDASDSKAADKERALTATVRKAPAPPGSAAPAAASATLDTSSGGGPGWPWVLSVCDINGAVTAVPAKDTMLARDVMTLAGEMLLLKIDETQVSCDVDISIYSGTINSLVLCSPSKAIPCCTPGARSIRVPRCMGCALCYSRYDVALCGRVV